MQGKRQESLEGYVTSLLPDLSEATIGSLSRKFPGFVNLGAVENLKKTETATIQGQLDRLKLKFEMTSCDVKRMELEAEVAKETEYKRLNGSVLDGLLQIPGYKALVDSGYGTDNYPYKFTNLQYYKDWSRADAIVEKLQKSNWSEVLSGHNSLLARIYGSRDTIVRFGLEIRELDADQTMFNSLKEAMKNVDDLVLQKLRVKLRAKLDSLDPLPSWMQDVETIDKKISLNRRAIDETLQPRREKITEQLVRLQDVMARVSQSKQKEVPDKYVEVLRQKNRNLQSQSRRGSGSSRSRSSSCSVMVNNTWGNDNWFRDYIVYDALFNHFDRSTYNNHEHQSHHNQQQSYSDPREINEQNYGRVS